MTCLLPLSSSACALRAPARRSISSGRSASRFACQLLFGSILTFTISAPGLARTLRVHPDSAAAAVPDYVATILEANALVTAGDSIEVSAAGSPYVHTAVMTIHDGVVYRGGYGPAFEGPNTMLYETVIRLELDPGFTDSVLQAPTTGSSTLLAGFTVTGGNSSFSGGGLQCDPGTALTVRNCRFVDNHADGVGGGITVGAQSSVSVFNCDFENSTARLRGGAISVAAGSEGSRVELCRFTDCAAATEGAGAGGGGALFTAAGIVFTRNTVQACSSGTDGGAILARNAPDFECTTNWMFDNRATRNGGTILQDGGTALYRGLEIERGTAAGNGGAIFFQNGTSTLSDSFIRECVAAVGGGGLYYFEPSASLVTTSEFVSNTAATGGAIYIRGLPFARSYSINVFSNTFVFNAASDPQAGGGIHIEAGGFLDEISNNILSNQLDGSGISCFGATNQPLIRYNCLFNVTSTNADPIYDGDCDDRTPFNHNISSNPRFCDLSVTPPQLGLDAFSPCLGAGLNGENMGAHDGSDCALIRVEPTSWSRIKSYYR